MSDQESRKANQHALNLFICWELKEVLQETAQRFDRTVADIVRLALRLSLPILKGACESRQQLSEEIALLFERKPGSARKEVAARIPRD
ncbi:MAG: hypothetical protein ABIJ61_02140 [bacterium]